MKLWSNGNSAWIRRAGGNGVDDEGRGVAVDSKRHVNLVGMSNGPLGGQAWHGSYDAWIRKYRP